MYSMAFKNLQQSLSMDISRLAKKFWREQEGNLVLGSSPVMKEY